MGVIDITRLVIELEERSRTYRKKHDKDNYIEFLEEKNTILLNEYRDLYEENEKLKDLIKTKDSIELSDYHLNILSVAVTNKNSINQSTLDELYSQDSNYKIAFSELLDKSYFEENNVFLQYSSGVVEYYISDKKATSIYKMLKEHNMLK